MTPAWWTDPAFWVSVASLFVVAGFSWKTLILSNSLERVLRRTELWTLRDAVRDRLGPLTALLVILSECEAHATNHYAAWALATPEQWSADSLRLLTALTEVTLRSGLSVDMQLKLLPVRIRHEALSEHYLGRGPAKTYSRKALQEQFESALRDAKSVVTGQMDILGAEEKLIKARTQDEIALEVRAHLPLRLRRKAEKMRRDRLAQGSNDSEAELG